MSRLPSLLAALVVAVSMLAALSGAAAAHERRNVGPYQLVVGWLNEPAFQGAPNAASVRVTDPRVTPAKAVEGLEKTLAIQVFHGGLTTGFSGKVRAVFGQPGLYALDIIPTSDGSYKFKINGKIESTDVNETFESGPTTFNDVQSAAALQYPDSVPAGAALTARLSEIDSATQQLRILAATGLVLAIASVALALRRRKA